MAGSLRYYSLYSSTSNSNCLLHHPYVKVLPKREQLIAPLHFTDAELELFKGTNLYGATQDRKKERYREWKICRDAIVGVNAEVGKELTWCVSF